VARVLPSRTRMFVLIDAKFFRTSRVGLEMFII
jgi:hypothetical protein